MGLAGASISRPQVYPPFMQIASGAGLFFEFPTVGIGVGNAEKVVPPNDFSCAF
jgi:hypothetical protein